MRRDKAKTTRRIETPRATAWERNQARGRDTSRDALIAAGSAAARRRRTDAAGAEDAPDAHPETAGSRAGGRPAHPEGIRGMEGSTNQPPSASATETANGRGPGGAGDAGGATAQAEGIAEAQRAANAAREQALYAGAPAWAIPDDAMGETEESVDHKPTAAQTEVLAKSIGTCFIVGSGMMARRRTEQWPQGRNGEPAGAFWQIHDDEALQLGRAWAAVIAEFSPVEMIGGASVLVVAMFSTGMSIGSRVMEDMDRAGMVKEMQAAIRSAEEGRAEAQEAA